MRLVEGGVVLDRRGVEPPPVRVHARRETAAIAQATAPSHAGGYFKTGLSLDYRDLNGFDPDETAESLVYSVGGKMFCVFLLKDGRAATSKNTARNPASL